MSLDATDSSGKRKHVVGPRESATSGSVAKKGKMSGKGKGKEKVAQLESELQGLQKMYERRNALLQQHFEREHEFGLSEVMNVFRTLPGVVEGDEFWFKTSMVMKKKETEKCS
ncbi:unnamed protein product [Cuscuta epithymum]|uniref:Uncharacterized protein n=1 Tax=Cuscuta epithymum TaxID=186058 RepID=A0AAV0C2B8_9ASTE|nr:unnamed protein product [Cuscuta epithymum]